MMKKILFWTVLLAVTATLAMLAYNGATHAATGSEAMNGAFQDGAYLGKLAATRSESARPPVGRWSSPEDRESFVAGYNLAYSRNASFRRPNPNADAAFRDGLYLGRLDAEQGRALHVASGRWARSADRDSFGVGYRRAYEEAASFLTQRAKDPWDALLVHP